jgi:predicted metal-dependent hydrolase
MEVDIVRKSIKNLHLSVYPPTGRIRVAVPEYVNDEAVKLAVITRLGWIKRQRKRLLGQTRQTPREYISGESHYYIGRRYRLDVVAGKPHVKLKNKSIIQLSVNANSTPKQRELIMNRWKRQQLASILSELLQKWEPLIGVTVDDWRIKVMYTKWGTCNTEAGRIWFNLDLIRMPSQFIEYVVVHEMAHLRERNHGAGFQGLMDSVLPQWRELKGILSEYPLVTKA